MGGPSEPLTPLGDRRTVYGKVSRYKLDEFLQLFDFPSPTRSAEQRFTTNVPLQRLFFMNSDFMQQQAERLAERVADEPDDARADRRRRIGSSSAARRRPTKLDGRPASSCTAEAAASSTTNERKAEGGRRRRRRRSGDEAEAADEGRRATAPPMPNADADAGRRA